MAKIFWVDVGLVAGKTRKVEKDVDDYNVFLE